MRRAVERVDGHDAPQRARPGASCRVASATSWRADSIACRCAPAASARRAPRAASCRPLRRQADLSSARALLGAHDHRHQRCGALEASTRASRDGSCRSAASERHLDREASLMAAAAQQLIACRPGPGRILGVDRRRTRAEANASRNPSNVACSASMSIEHFLDRRLGVDPVGERLHQSAQRRSPCISTMCSTSSDAGNTPARSCGILKPAVQVRAA